MTPFLSQAKQLRQEDVFKSISDNVGSSGDPRTFYVFAAVGVGLVFLLLLVNALMKRRATPRAVNHQGKLVKELMRKVPLRKGEVKQLRAMAAEQGCESPLTLVLCPSLIAKGLNEKGRADKRVVMGVARKMGIVKKK
jgi:heme exporter protein D